MTITTQFVETADRVFQVDTVEVRPGVGRSRVRVVSGREPTAAEWAEIIAALTGSDQ